MKQLLFFLTILLSLNNAFGHHAEGGEIVVYGESEGGGGTDVISIPADFFDRSAGFLLPNIWDWLPPFGGGPGGGDDTPEPDCDDILAEIAKIKDEIAAYEKEIARTEEKGFIIIATMPGPIFNAYIFNTPEYLSHMNDLLSWLSAAELSLGYYEDMYESMDECNEEGDD